MPRLNEFMTGGLLRKLGSNQLKETFAVQAK